LPKPYLERYGKSLKARQVNMRPVLERLPAAIRIKKSRQPRKRWAGFFIVCRAEF